MEISCVFEEKLEEVAPSKRLPSSVLPFPDFRKSKNRENGSKYLDTLDCTARRICRVEDTGKRAVHPLPTFAQKTNKYSLFFLGEFLGKYSKNIRPKIGFQEKIKKKKRQIFGPKLSLRQNRLKNSNPKLFFCQLPRKIPPK